MSAQPLVSICIPAFNVEKYIRQTLEALIVQSYSAIEIIIVNDGSTDNTLAEINKVADQRIKLISISNSGSAHARNTAFKNSSGNYIIFFDADDLIDPDFVEQQVKLLQMNSNAVVLAQWGRFYNDDLNTFIPEPLTSGELSFRAWILRYWQQANPMTNPGRAIVSRKAIEAAGLWNESLSLNDDLDFFTRLFMVTEKIVFNDNAFLYYRSGVSGLSGKKGEKPYLSLYNSLLLATTNAMSIYKDDQEVATACTNMWQSFKYEIYPKYQNIQLLVKRAQEKLPVTTLPFPAGGFTKYLVNVLGWKLSKKIKSVLNI